MSAQLSLLGVAPPAVTDRLFFALFPPPEVAARMVALLHGLCGRYGLRGRPVPAERLHVTLHHINDYAGLPPDEVRGALNAGEALAAAGITMAAKKLVFDQVASFASNPRKPMLVLRGRDGVPAAMGLQQALAAPLVRQLPKLRLPASYTPHVTLLYGDPRQGDMRQVEQDIAPIAWQASEIVLVHSLLGQSLHKPLARWRLPD